MKKKKLYAGGRKVTPGTLQAEMQSGQEQNRATKQNFKVGPHARNDRNAGRADGPLIPAKFVAEPPKKAGASDE